MSRIKKEKVSKERKERKIKITKKGMAMRILTVIVIAATALIAGFGVIYTKTSKDLAKRTDFGEGVVAKFNGTDVPIAQFMLYSVDIRNSYEEQYGSSIWNMRKVDAYGNDSTYEKVAKEDILEQIRFVWAVCKEGEKEKIKMSPSEEKTIRETAEDYYKQLIDAGIDRKTVTSKDVKKFYRDNYYAQKAFYKISGVNTVASGDATSGNSMSTDDAQKLWEKLVNRWYPDFNYNVDINWSLLDQIRFSGNSASGDASKEKAAGSSAENSTEP